jgi:saccharopine dehydrogenase-like NADP-dependent oxidoreductase
MSGSTIITLLGSSGGVANAILSILNKSISDKNDPLHLYINHCELHLIDCNQKDMQHFIKTFPNLKKKIKLYNFHTSEIEKFMNHLKNTKTSLVIDASWSDTVNTISCCNKLGVHYVNTALENTSVDENEDIEEFGMLERYKIFEQHKQHFKNITGIVGSGMNPGVVQWMFLEMMKKFPNEKPLACYVVEKDNSFYADKSLANKDTIYTTWSPECFLDEAIANYPMFVKNHTPLFIYREVYDQKFKVTLGKKTFYGYLMPHEEVMTLGKLFDMEFGFIYSVNKHTTKLIRKNLNNPDILWEKQMVVLNPFNAPLIGRDMVGVLLVYNNKERYMYNVMKNTDVFAKYHTNATYFQVACGIYGAICTVLLDNLSLGVYYVDELILNNKTNYGKYLTYYMKNFIVGENNFSDGLLLDRLKTTKG